MIPYRNAPERNACILLEEAENLISELVSTLELANSYSPDPEINEEIQNLFRVRASIERIRRRKCSEK